MPRLHLVACRKFNYLEKTWTVVRGPQQGAQVAVEAPPDPTFSLARTREELLTYLRLVFDGDQIAAEYVLIWMLSRVHARPQYIPVGKLALALALPVIGVRASMLLSCAVFDGHTILTTRLLALSCVFAGDVECYVGFPSPADGPRGGWCTTGGFGRVAPCRHAAHADAASVSRHVVDVCVFPDKRLPIEPPDEWQAAALRWHQARAGRNILGAGLAEQHWGLEHPCIADLGPQTGRRIRLYVPQGQSSTRDTA